jgi:hypothetical protein
MINLTPHERLAQRKKAMEKKLGVEIDYDNLYRLGLDQELTSDIIASLESSVVLDITKGFYYLSGLLNKFKLDEFGPTFGSFLTKKLSELIEHPDLRVKYKAIPFYVYLSPNFPNYREKMMGFLMSKDLGLRKLALRNYESFCKPGEVEPLLQFERDDYAGEIGMLGDLFYELRDLALEKIEKQLGCSFFKKRLSELHDGRKAYWNDWQPFKEWWHRS